MRTRKSLTKSKRRDTFAGTLHNVNGNRAEKAQDSPIVSFHWNTELKKKTKQAALRLALHTRTRNAHTTSPLASPGGATVTWTAGEVGGGNGAGIALRLWL